jgi:predicted ribosomally synthesized peptide with SipW-like signal peptide
VNVDMAVVDVVALRPGRGLGALTVRRAIVALVVLLAAGGASAGTWASFTASTSNEASFSTGTLMLSNTVGAASACFSTAVGDQIDTNDRSCDALFPVAIHAPGGTASADVAIKNQGSLAGTLMAYVPTCANTDSAAAYHGSGLLCGALQVSVQEYTDASRTTISDCRYGAVTGVGVTCAFGPSLAALATAHGDFANGLALDALTPGQTRWYRVRLLLPASAGNTLQGRSATFGLTWRMVEQ